MPKLAMDSITYMKQGITRNKELISHEQVLVLAREVQIGLDLIESFGFKRKYSQEAAIALKGNPVFELGLRSRNKLVVGNMRFALKKAHYFAYGANRQDMESLEDFIQAANTRLPHAVERYDPEKGYRITTFIAFYIRDAVFFERKRMCMSSLKVSIPLLQIKATLASKTEQLVRALGRQPTKQELADAYKVSVNTIQRAIDIPPEVSIFSAKSSAEQSGAAPVLLIDELESKIVERDANISLYESLVDEYGEPGYHLFQQFIYSDVFNKLKLGLELNEEELTTVNKLIKLLKI